jgi:hypothetical protein
MQPWFCVVTPTDQRLVKECEAQSPDGGSRHFAHSRCSVHLAASSLSANLCVRVQTRIAEQLPGATPPPAGSVLP